MTTTSTTTTTTTTSTTRTHTHTHTLIHTHAHTARPTGEVLGGGSGRQAGAVVDDQGRGPGRRARVEARAAEIHRGQEPLVLHECPRARDGHIGRCVDGSETGRNRSRIGQHVGRLVVTRDRYGRLGDHGAVHVADSRGRHERDCCALLRPRHRGAVQCERGRVVDGRHCDITRHSGGG